MHERKPGHRNDAGFSMVEIVIAMLLFAFLSVAVIPLIIGITTLTAQNRDLEQARGAVSADIAAMRVQFPSDPGSPSSGRCTQINSDSISPTQQQVGNDLVITRTAAACPVSFPGSVALRYEVTRVSSGQLVSDFETSLRVTQ